MMNITELVHAIIKETYDILNEIKNKKYSNTRLMFPNYSDGLKTRISEQELKQIFIEVFNRKHKAGEHDFLYAVETPTREKYTFSCNGNKKVPKCDNKGRSARIDMTIHDKGRTWLAIIEFKEGNPDKLEYEKDFCKLYNEEAVGRFFIQLIEKWNSRTRENIRSKYEAVLEGEHKKDGVEIKLYTLFLGKRGEVIKDL